MNITSITQTEAPLAAELLATVSRNVREWHKQHHTGQKINGRYHFSRTIKLKSQFHNAPLISNTRTLIHCTQMHGEWSNRSVGHKLLRLQKNTNAFEAVQQSYSYVPNH